MDFVGLNILTVIQKTLDQIYMKHGIRLRFREIPDNDAKTYEMLSQGDTTGVFQMESSGMQKLCRRFGVSRLEDICALIAFFRPGPLQWLEEFLERREGKVKVEYDVPAMEPILSETYGIMLYQEQVMQVIQAIAGVSLAEADSMRRAIAPRGVQRMEMMVAQFVEGAKKNGYTEPIAKQIWDKLFKFAGYAFNKSHAAAYALLTYRAAYLKANYPDEYLAVLKREKKH